MYKEIGDIFEYQGITLQVVEPCNILCEDCPLYSKEKECDSLQQCCINCYFYKTFGPCDTISCSSTERKDHKDVIFKQIK